MIQFKIKDQIETNKLLVLNNNLKIRFLQGAQNCIIEVTQKSIDENNHLIYVGKIRQRVILKTIY